MSLVEVRVRRFYTGDEADCTPAICVVVEEERLLSAETDWSALVGHVDKLAADAPLSNIRQMTNDEVVVYRATEDDE